MKTFFVDAQEMARKHPDTFKAPTKKELKSIKVGDFVKVCANNEERFWVMVKSVEGNQITGTIDNQLICKGHGLKYQDQITFYKKNIYQKLEEK